MNIVIDFRTDFYQLDHFPIATRSSIVEQIILKKHPAPTWRGNLVGQNYA